MIKCLYLNKQAISDVPIYSNLVYTCGYLPDVSFKYKRVKIALPNELISDVYYKIIKHFKKLFNYNYVQYNFYLKENNLFLDVIYIDRSSKLDYKYAKRDMVFYKFSGKLMKDINKYNADNKNHHFIKKGDIIPKFYKNSDDVIEVVNEKQELYSAPFDSKIGLSMLKLKLRDLKSKVADIINKLLSSLKSKVIYLRSNDYIKKGFKCLAKYVNTNLLKKNKVMKNKEVDDYNRNVFEHNYNLMKDLGYEYFRTGKNNRTL